MLLQAVIVVVRWCSNFFNNHSTLSLVTAIASAIRMQVMAKDGEAIRKTLEGNIEATTGSSSNGEGYILSSAQGQYGGHQFSSYLSPYPSPSPSLSLPSSQVWSLNL
jgi:hypothetical protein